MPRKLAIARYCRSTPSSIFSLPVYFFTTSFCYFFSMFILEDKEFNIITLSKTWELMFLLLKYSLIVLIQLIARGCASGNISLLTIIFKSRTETGNKSYSSTHSFTTMQNSINEKRMLSLLRANLSNYLFTSSNRSFFSFLYLHLMALFLSDPSKTDRTCSWLKIEVL